MNRLWIIPLLILLGASALHAQDLDDTEQATGTVFFLSGGTGAGEVHLFTGQRLLRFEYSDTYIDRRFALGSEFRNGAIWQVRYRRLPEGTLRLEQVQNTGQVDGAVRAADSLVRSHYSQLARGDYRSAYANLHPDIRLRYSYEAFTGSFRGATFARLDSPGYAVKVVARTDSSVQLLVDMSNFVQGDTRYFRFDIEQIDGQWFIGTTSEVGVGEWERG
jgi:hypothetical protein